NDVAQRVKIEVQIKRDAVIEANAFIVYRVAADEAETERNDFPVLSPDKKPRAVRHPLSNGAEIIFGQRLKFQWRSLVDSQIQRINFVDQKSDFVQYLHLDVRCVLGFAKLSTQIFPCGLAERAEIFIPVCVRERQPRHWHA